MPRLPADPIARLAVLEAARAEAEPDLVVNFADMARIAGMTDRNLKLIIDRDSEFPIVARGDQGVAWQLNVVAVLDHMIGQAEKARGDREAQSARVHRLVGLGETAGAKAGTNGHPVREMLEGAKAISAMVDAQAKIRAEKQGQGRLVDRSKVEALLWDMMTTMQTETLAIAAKMDPAGQWEPGLKGSVEEELRNVLLAVRGALELKLADWHGPGG